MNKHNAINSPILFLIDTLKQINRLLESMMVMMMTMAMNDIFPFK